MLITSTTANLSGGCEELQFEVTTENSLNREVQNFHIENQDLKTSEIEEIDDQWEKNELTDERQGFESFKSEDIKEHIDKCKDLSIAAEERLPPLTRANSQAIKQETRELTPEKANLLLTGK